jgi:hypothetical protein
MKADGCNVRRENCVSMKFFDGSNQAIYTRPRGSQILGSKTSAATSTSRRMPVSPRKSRAPPVAIIKHHQSTLGKITIRDFSLENCRFQADSGTHRGGASMHEKGAFLCSICFQPINLDQCKIDEDGRPVHESCYTDRLLFAVPKKKPHHEESWSRLALRFVRIPRGK